jgi:hypothetical protein
MFTHFVSELKTKEGSLFRLVMKHPARSRGGVDQEGIELRKSMS